MENQKLSKKKQIAIRQFALSVAMEIADQSLIPIDPRELAKEIYHWVTTGEDK